LVAILTLALLGNRAELGRCESVPATTVAVIEQGSDLPGFSLSDARAVRSTDFNKVWFISGRITADGEPSSVGTWATNDLALGAAAAGFLTAVDTSARSSTDWGSAGGIGDISMSDDGADLSRRCVAEG
jgi:hypothetical protein